MKYRTFFTLTAALFLVLAIWGAEQKISTLPAVRAQSDFSCANVTEIPLIECEALVAIYDANPNAILPVEWLVTDTPCSWESITCEDGHVTVLNLASKGLTILPPEISNLINLRALYLMVNELTTIPSEISSLSELTILALSYNALTTLLPEIGNLNSLEYLGLSNNALMGLPSEIGNLDNLTVLNLDSNELTSVPPEIGNLNNLTELSLANNWITSISPEIGNLDNLKTLRLNDNVLTNLPSEIGNLEISIVRKILLEGIPIVGRAPSDFRCVNVNEIPMGECEALVAIYYVHPDAGLPIEWLVTDMPCSWRSITCEDGHISVLNLGTIGLRTLPPEIGNLDNLTILNLVANELTSLPQEIGNLSNLEKLDLSYNNFTSVPQEIDNIPTLVSLSMEGNPLVPTALDVQGEPLSVGWGIFLPFVIR